MATATEEIRAPTEVLEGAPGSAFRPTLAGWMARGAVIAALAALVLLYPLSVEQFRAGEFAVAVVYAVIGLSLNVLLGYAGQISLGHQAFVGVGAFTSAYMVSEQGQNFVVAVSVAAAIGALQALVLGGVALRIRGLYFALITLSYGILAEESLFKIKSLTGGGAGQPAPRPSLFESDKAYYYLCLILLGAVLWVDWRMMKTKGGRALLALRENPRVAATLGINVRAFTLFSFVVAGTFAGIGGALLAHQTTQVVNVVFDFRLALVFIIMTVVGGLRSRSGVVIGSAFFALLGVLIDTHWTLPFTAVTIGLERPLARPDLTYPVLLFVGAAALAVVAARGRRFLHLVWTVAVGLGALVVLLPATLPFFEERIRKIPVLTPELAPLVVGPLLLLLTLTLYPGGIGQQIRPIQKWLRGGRFDIHERGEKEVVVSDVRA